MERFFDLAVAGKSEENRVAGFTGQITSNSFMKREFGKKLIEEQIPRWDLSHVIDTSGAYIPGHGTPTVIIFGKNSKPSSGSIRTVMGIKGEPCTPDDPAIGKVWSAIRNQLDNPGSEGEFISVVDIGREKLYKHPWSLSGGVAACVLGEIEEGGMQILHDKIDVIGRTVSTQGDEVFVRPSASSLNLRIARPQVRKFVIGEAVRDWGCLPEDVVVFPYDLEFTPVSKENDGGVIDYLWPFRAVIGASYMFGGKTKIQAGMLWYEYGQFIPERLRCRRLINFAFVATHNHFVLDRGGKLFNRSAPVIKLPADATEEDHLRLLGLLNSSTACFWGRQVFHPKGGYASGKWEERLEWDGTKLKKFPVPSEVPLGIAKRIDRLSLKLARFSPAAIAANNAVSFRELDEGEKESSNLRGGMISLQEELDWQCYRLYGLIDARDELEWPEDSLDDLPRLALGERAFEIRMARQMAAGELKTTWFERHKDAGSRPITQLPSQWPDDYRSLVERRLAFIESNKNINLIERPEYKRRWNIEPWEKRQKEALRKWLLARLEGYFFEGSRVCDLNGSYDPASHGFIAATRPCLTTVNQLADAVSADEMFLEVAEVYEGASGFSVPNLIRGLVEPESVPHLPVHRYSASGLRKRYDWEATWELQRKEDAVEAEVRGGEGLPQGRGDAEELELKTKVREAQQAQVGDIPVPPKYTTADFAKTGFWKLRGKLDVPKERWISYPGSERMGDDSLLIAWAGWGHLQQAQALAEYFLDAKDNQGWQPDRLKPLLAGLAYLIPWLKQWHNDHNPDYGMGLGDYFAGFLEEQCRGLELTVEEVNAARFETHADD